MAVNLPTEEIRFAVVLNGGVSLAVWMGGVVLELDRLTRAREVRGDLVYGRLLGLVGGVARADVITGTSAGGINGAALALSQVNRTADLRTLRNLWVEHGRFEQLLRKPFSGQPVSLLQGDEYFLPRLEEALGGLTAEFRATEAEARPVDLRITTTLLNGVPKVTYDDLGQALPQSIHQGSFSFRRDPFAWARPPGETTDRDDFTDDGRPPGPAPDLVRRIALAARSTASFPFAFEPSFVPVGGDGSKPDMGRAADWFKDAVDRSRFAVDGGVLVNTPTKEALEAIDRMPADGPVRRVMMLVFPHAPTNDVEPVADSFDTGPTIIGLGGRLLSAMYSQSGRTYVDKVEDHNRAASSRRGGRNALLTQLYAQNPTVAQEIYRLSRTLFNQYRDVRIRHAARQLTTRQFEVHGSNQEGWSFERARAAAEAAQRRRLAEGGLPYVPVNPPPATIFGTGNDWPWGFTMAERLASGALDLLKRLVWVVTDDDCDKIAKARMLLHRSRCTIRSLRAELDVPWTADSSPSLDRAYWTRRLAGYEERMIGANPAIGRRVRHEVTKIGHVLYQAQRILAKLDNEKRKLAGVEAWHALLLKRRTGEESGLSASPGVWRRIWLSRMLALEIAATCVADTAPTGLDQPVELVQVSLQTRNPFTTQTLTSDDKAAGASLARFSGFLKRSWRVNDWIWGRLDGATMLCRVLLAPERLRRQNMLVPLPGDNARKRAEGVVDGLVATLFGAAPAALQGDIAAAVDELTEIYDAGPTDDLSPSATALADLAAWGLHIRIITEELPALRAAILADGKDGANPRSRGELFIAEHDQLLRELPHPEAFDVNPSEDLVRLGFRALEAFDQAGIGREPLKDEAGGDQLIRTAATAMGVAVSVLDSDRSGLTLAKPVLKALRGGALIPYWMANGLTKGGRIAQATGLLAVAAGAALLMLALFSLLPPWATAPAASLGAGTLLGAFGYSALRSGSMLHGLVLLSPVVPLGAIAVSQWLNADDAEAGTAAITLGGVVAVVVALMVLGSLPVIRRTPLALLVDLLKRISPSAVVIVAAGIPLLAFVTSILVPAFTPIIAAVRPFVIAHVLRTALLIDGVIIIGACSVAWWHGRKLRRWQRSDDGRWKLGRAEHPAAATAGWAAVYGAGYLLVATLLALTMWKIGIDPPHFIHTWLDDHTWVAATVLLTAAMFALVLLFVTPWFVPMRARRKIRQTLLDEAEPAVYATMLGVHTDLRRRLETCGTPCRYLLKRAGGDLALRAAGERIARDIRMKLWQA